MVRFLALHPMESISLNSFVTVDTQCAISSWFTLFGYDVKCNNSWPNFVIQHPCVDAPTAHCAILQKLSHRLISIYTILYTYIVDDVLARICIYVLYYLQNSTQFILLLDPPTGSQYNTDSELWRVKRKLYYMKPSSQSPFLFSSNFGKGPSHATRLMTVYISRAVVFKDCVFVLATKVVNNDRS